MRRRTACLLACLAFLPAGCVAALAPIMAAGGMFAAIQDDAPAPAAATDAAASTAAPGPQITPLPEPPAPLPEQALEATATADTAADASPDTAPDAHEVRQPDDAAPPIDHAANRAFLDFGQYALVQAISPARPRKSALIADPASLNPEMRECGSLPLAVLIDLDPPGGLLPLGYASRANPALAEALPPLRTNGITIAWITNHPATAARSIRTLLAETGLDARGDDLLLVMRFATERKQARRTGLAETHCLMAIAGDERADFDELFDYLRDPALARPLDTLIGNGWFLTPKPID